MADFEKVRTGHERWTAQYGMRLTSRACLHDGTSAARDYRTLAWPGGVASSLRCRNVSNAFVLLSPSLVVQLPGRPLAVKTLVFFYFFLCMVISPQHLLYNKLHQLPDT